MSDKPIPFSAPMVRALLDGRKHQTRRIVKPLSGTAPLKPGDILVRWGPDFGGTCATFRPAYVVGDRLWVKEAWRFCSQIDAVRPAEMSHHEPRRYEADGLLVEPSCLVIHQPGRYRHARFMPRRFSRITLTVTDVRVQRVAEISEADAVAEGAPSHDSSISGIAGIFAKNHPGNYIATFRNIWNSIHGPDAWARNDWVCAVTFTVRKGNIDQ
jgi:hypothetical protein